MSIVPFLESGAFGPETIKILAAAFEEAWDTVNTSGSPLADEAHIDATRERLARYIIDMAQNGEKDHRRLVDEALARLAEGK
jgi:hypothetical protein